MTMAEWKVRWTRETWTHESRLQPWLKTHLRNINEDTYQLPSGDEMHTPGSLYPAAAKQMASTAGAGP